MTTSELMSEFPQLSRDRLYSWERKGWVEPRKIPRGERMQGNDFPAKEVLKIRIMLLKTDQGFSAEAAAQRALELVVGTDDALSQIDTEMLRFQETGDRDALAEVAISYFALTMIMFERGEVTIAEQLGEISISLFKQSGLTHYIVAPHRTLSGVPIHEYFHDDVVRGIVEGGGIRQK
jgi:hypothetical protein